MKLVATIATDDHTNGYIKADLIESGVDGWDTYHWEFGIDAVTGAGKYLMINEGEIQHRECDGSFKLIGMIIKKLGIKL